MEDLQWVVWQRTLPDGRSLEITPMTFDKYRLNVAPRGLGVLRRWLLILVTRRRGRGGRGVGRRGRSRGLVSQPTDRQAQAGRRPGKGVRGAVRDLVDQLLPYVFIVYLIAAIWAFVKVYLLTRDRKRRE